MAKISVAGKIVKEISYNVPSTKFAMIELIKNSYEAMANKVTISVNESRIQIIDDGEGMNEEEIETLLTLSDSNKSYGQEINGRFISGEKGLGFFSAFKFGNIIEVFTSKEGYTYNFKIDMKEIEAQRNLYDLDIDINKVKTDNGIIKGTKIIISDINKEMFTLFKNTLDSEAEYSRLSNVILDDNFKININKSWGETVNSFVPSEKLENARMLLATFDSTNMFSMEKNNKKYYIKLTRGNQEFKEIVDQRYNKLLEIDGLFVLFDINIYSLKGLGIANVPQIFHLEKSKKIVPLIYINNSLFDNYALYDTDINAKSGNNLVFRQQTGIIKLFLNRPDILNFNPDRTMITESKNQKLLQDFLDFISSKIQIRLREIIDSEKDQNQPQKPQQEQPIYTTKNIFIRETYTLESNKSKIQTITKDGEKYNEVDFNSPGTWKVTYDDGNILILKVIDYPDPLVKPLKKIFEVGKEYSFDEIFGFEDCKGGNKIIPLHFEINPQGSRSMNNKNKTVTFNKHGEVEFYITIHDKISNKEKEFSSKGIVNVKHFQSNTIYEKQLLHPLMQIPENLKADIILFKKEINELYKIGNFDMVLVSSVRTFVELVISDIVDALGEAKSKELSENHRKINKFVKEKFINEIDDMRERSGVDTIYKDAVRTGKTSNTIEFLNLTTHGAQRILGKEQILSDVSYINFLYTYLCFLLKK